MGWSRVVVALALAFAVLGGGGAALARRIDPAHRATAGAAAPEAAVRSPAPQISPQPVAPATTAAPPACQPGTDSTVSVTDASAPHGVRTVWVHRPAGPDRSDIPVVYVLHGYPADPAGLAAGTLNHLLDAEMCRTGRPFVVAIPDGRAGDLDTEWGDDAHGRFAVETFVTQRAVALVEGTERRPATLRAIAGFSMGGYGAATLALRHPDEYRQVASFSGYYRTDDPDHVFGRGSAAHAPDQLLRAAGGQRYFLVEGTDENTPLQVGSIRGEADRFAAALRARGVTVSVAHPPGGHSDACWYPELGAMVDFLGAGWSA